MPPDAHLLWLPAGAGIAAFLLTVGSLRPAISVLSRLQGCTYHRLRQDIDNRVFYRLHSRKIGVPTAGGLVIAATSAPLCIALHPTATTEIFVLGLLVFVLIGLLDDVSKLLMRSGRSSLDLQPTVKFPLQLLASLGVALLFTHHLGAESLRDVGIFSSSLATVLIWTILVLGITGAVNITDGVDGLAPGLCIIGLVAFAILSWRHGNTGALEIAFVFIGSTLGFLLFNRPPARIFLGDVGSASLGFVLCALAMILNQPLFLLLVTVVFVADMVTSGIQKVALRSNKRVFIVAPAHHHLEALGWSETTIDLAFWSLGTASAIAGLIAVS